MKDRYLQPDFSAMRLQWLLHGMCAPERAVHSAHLEKRAGGAPGVNGSSSGSGSTALTGGLSEGVDMAGSPCGVGSLFFPQAPPEGILPRPSHPHPHGPHLVATNAQANAYPAKMDVRCWVDQLSGVKIIGLFQCSRSRAHTPV